MTIFILLAIIQSLIRLDMKQEEYLSISGFSEHKITFKGLNSFYENVRLHIVSIHIKFHRKFLSKSVNKWLGKKYLAKSRNITESHSFFLWDIENLTV